jgi:hypothetical protein
MIQPIVRQGWATGKILDAEIVPNFDKYIPAISGSADSAGLHPCQTIIDNDNLETTV